MYIKYVDGSQRKFVSSLDGGSSMVAYDVAKWLLVLLQIKRDFSQNGIGVKVIHT